MAFFNEIGAARYNRFIQRLLNMKGGPPARQLASDIMMVMQFFNGVENRLIESWFRYGAFINVPASAANLGGVRLRNFGNSKVIAVIERVEISVPATDQPRLRIGQAGSDLGTIASLVNAALDARASITTPSLQLSSQNTAPTVPALTNQFSIAGPNMAANTFNQFVQTENQEIPLAPQAAIQIESTTVNQAIAVGILWRERSLEDSELAV